MKGWLGRAEANTVLRGGQGSRIARWSLWFRRSGPVADSRFQGQTDPHPRHWRDFPPPWPPTALGNRVTRRHLRDALDQLPVTWRAVVYRRDIAGRSDMDVAGELGITQEQERAILTRARAALRDQLADLLGRQENR